MKCSNCCQEFEEKNLDLSHDIPCYLFEGNRKGRKNQADKFPRHWLCKNCHERYEISLREFLRQKSFQFAVGYFKEGAKNGDGISKF